MRGETSKTGPGGVRERVLQPKASRPKAGPTRVPLGPAAHWSMPLSGPPQSCTVDKASTGCLAQALWPAKNNQHNPILSLSCTLKATALIKAPLLFNLATQTYQLLPNSLHRAPAGISILILANKSAQAVSPADVTGRFALSAPDLAPQASSSRESNDATTSCFRSGSESNQALRSHPAAAKPQLVRLLRSLRQIYLPICPHHGRFRRLRNPHANSRDDPDRPHQPGAFGGPRPEPLDRRRHTRARPLARRGGRGC